MQQPIWTDMKAIMFYYFPPTRYERDYIIWLMESDVDRNSTWLSRNIYSRNNRWNKTALANNKDVPTKYQLLQHIVPNATRGQTNTRRFTGKNTCGISCVPNQASVPLNETTNLEQFEYYSIQPRVQRNNHE